MCAELREGGRGRASALHCAHFCARRYPQSTSVCLAKTNGREPPWGVGIPGEGVLKGTPARVPSRIPGGDSSFPNGGPFGVAQTKSTSYDSGGDPTGTRFYPQNPE